MVYDLIELGGFIALLCFIAYMYSVWADLQKKKQSVQQQVIGKRSKASFHDMIDNVPFALEQATQLYNEQFSVLEQKYLDAEKRFKDGKLTQEELDAIKAESLKVLEPLKKRIDMLNTVKTWEPAVRIGADVGDKITQVINKALDQFGRGGL